MKSTFKSIFICALAIALSGSFAFADTVQGFTAELAQTQALPAQNVAVEETVVIGTSIAAGALLTDTLEQRQSLTVDAQSFLTTYTSLGSEIVPSEVLERYDKLYF